MLEVLLGVLQGPIESACHRTARLLLPLMSLGYLRVLDPAPPPPGKRRSRRGPLFERLPNGQIAVQADPAAVLIGLAIWVALAAGVILYFNL